MCRVISRVLGKGAITVEQLTSTSDRHFLNLGFTSEAQVVNSNWTCNIVCLPHAGHAVHVYKTQHVNIPFSV